MSVDPVFALDAQAGDIASLLLFLSLAGFTLFLALRGSWWATAPPAAIVALGAAAYLTSEPDSPGSGEFDPARLAGMIFLYFGGAALLLTVVLVLLARWLR
jgi:hypothetical protein